MPPYNCVIIVTSVTAYGDLPLLYVCMLLKIVSTSVANFLHVAM